MPINSSRFPWKKALAMAACAGLLMSSAAPFASAQKSDDLPEADQKALAAYHLTLEKLDQFDAANKKIAAAMRTDPLLAKEMARNNALNFGTTIDDALGQFDNRAPHLAAVIKAAGMTDRDYVMMIFSIMFAATGQTLKQYAPDKPLPAYVSADNVAFAEKNRGRFQEVVTNLDHLSAKDKKHQSNDETTTED